MSSRQPGSSSLKGMKVYFPPNIDLHGITLELKLVWQLYQHKMAILSKRILFCVTHFSNFNQKKLFVDSANLKKYINYSKKRQIVKENSNLVYIIHILFWFHTFFSEKQNSIVCFEKDTFNIFPSSAVSEGFFSLADYLYLLV